MPNGIKGIRTNKCSKCKQIAETPSRRYCKKCHSEYMKNYRLSHKLSDEQKFKHNVRAKTRMRIRRGTLKKQSCVKCHNPKAEAHHENYLKPYNIVWLCFICHRNYHKGLITLNETNGT